MKHRIISGLIALIAVLWFAPAQAARSFSASQTSPTPTPGQFDMGTTQSVTMGVTNTSTGGNSDERLFQVQFQLSTTACSPTPCTNTVFSSSTTAPAGWTRTGFSATSVTFKANSFADALGSTAQSPTVPPTTGSFALVLVVGTFTADLSQTLSQVTARLSPNAAFNGSHPVNCTSGPCLGSWKAMALQITSFQTTDLSGNPIGGTASGNSFRVVITVKNVSTATQNGIVANPSPPTANKVGTWRPTSPNCSLTGTNPSPLNLASGASGTITYTCTTVSAAPTDNGTTSFTAAVRNGTNTATSRSATSNVITVSPVAVQMDITPICLFSGSTATMKLTVTNSTLATIFSVTPSALTITPANGASTSSLTGPLPASIASLAPGASGTFTWTATVTGTVDTTLPKPAITASASVSYNVGGPAQTTPAASHAEDVDDFIVSVSPTSTNAASVNAELTFHVKNRGCGNNVAQVTITAPAGWTASSDVYSIVTDTLGNSLENNWTVSGTTFSAPNPAAQMPTDKTGDFSVVFSATPSSAGTSVFTVSVTDGTNTANHNGPETTVTVNAFRSGTLNQTQPSIWREIFQ